jgi:hypothetical protein
MIPLIPAAMNINSPMSIMPTGEASRSVDSMALILSHCPSRIEAIDPRQLNPPLRRNQAEIRETALGRFGHWIWDMGAIGRWYGYCAQARHEILRLAQSYLLM